MAKPPTFATLESDLPASGKLFLTVVSHGFVDLV